MMTGLITVEFTLSKSDIESHPQLFAEADIMKVNDSGLSTDKFISVLYLGVDGDDFSVEGKLIDASIAFDRVARCLFSEKVEKASLRMDSNGKQDYKVVEGSVMYKQEKEEIASKVNSVEDYLKKQASKNPVTDLNEDSPSLTKVALAYLAFIAFFIGLGVFVVEMKLV